MKKKTFIFIGNSGCGKGTQIKLIEKKILKQQESVIITETGKSFRKLFLSKTDTGKFAKKISKVGLLQPQFLAIYFWSKLLISKFNSQNHLIIDGSPRNLIEAQVLDEALKFYKIKNPIVIYLKISEKTVIKRLILRNRKDDKKDMIEERINWFNIEVMEVINFFKKSNYYTFVEVDGEKNIKEINEYILKKIKF